MGGRNMSTTIRVSRDTKNKLELLGSKNQSFDEIITSLIHQRNILAIHEICKDMNALTESIVMQVFEYINYEIPPAPETPNLNGETWYTHHNYTDAQIHYRKHIIEMAQDEDLVGAYREHIPVAEIMTNIYCLFEDIPAPTWNMSLHMKNPFARYD